MGKGGEQSKKENDTRQAKKLPAEIVGRALQNLSVGDRLKNERISPLWKHSLFKWGWTEQKKLDADIVFEDAAEEEIVRFWKNLDNDNCHLASLLRGCGLWLRELDLHSFGVKNIERILPQIVGSLQSLKKLEKLEIGRLRLQDFVDHLPPTLLTLKTWGEISVETLQALSIRCPNLEYVPFRDLWNKDDLETEAVIECIGKFPRQKVLDLFLFKLRSEKVGALAPIGQLKSIEKLDLWSCESLDGDSFEAIVQGCKRLRSLSCDTRQLNEGQLFWLAKFPNLKMLKVDDRYGGGFSDDVLKAIAARGQLNKLRIFGSNSNESLTDASIIYLVGCCKSLVSLAVYWFPQITEQSLEAVVAEVRRRHETAPGTFPSGNIDPAIFYFEPFCTGIDMKRARQLINRNPWLIIGVGDPRDII